MGPWYLDINKIIVFGNWPYDQSILVRIPRNPQVATNKTSTPLGSIGIWVSGVAGFNMLDAFSYQNAAAQDVAQTGDLIWNRNALLAEGLTFDPAGAHQPNNGQYHYHVTPQGLRFQLNDNLSYDSNTAAYIESTNNFTHSPLLGWAYDGYPIYGPYGYSDPFDPTSSIRRLAPGYQLRDGSNGTLDLSAAGRTSIPTWAAEAQGRTNVLNANKQGPNVSANFPLGWYVEDHDYLGDLGFTQGSDFDLDRFNGRTCITPDFPGGTYAYFTTVNANGSPEYPYILRSGVLWGTNRRFG
ncbi:MAG: YHYH protein [Kiritimatiellae bacterium]|nr:YHYH protein [Kiritimatiellia bacterium]